jgi:hypothetical protein
MTRTKTDKDGFITIEPKELKKGDIISIGQRDEGLFEVYDRQGDLVFIDDYRDKLSGKCFDVKDVKKSLYLIK